MNDTILDLLDHGCDGEPRWLMLDASDAAAAAQLSRAVALEAERRGYVPIAADDFSSLVRNARDDMRHRTFALLHTQDSTAPIDASALTRAAAFNARPHVLVTVVVARRKALRAPIVREARAAYAVDGDGRSIAWSAEAEKYLARGQQAFALARRGRHAPAVRMLREAAGALVRRREMRAAARVGIQLGRVLLERGHPDDAAAVFAEAVMHVDGVHAGEAAIGRVWVALARTDGGRLTEAEGLLRATRLAGALPEGLIRQWADAALARCLLWQDRTPEAGQLLDGHLALAADADANLVVPILSTHARVHVALGGVFDAGQRARAALEWAERSGDPVMQLMAGLAHLRVLASAGDLDLADERRQALLSQARVHHQPLHALRVRLIWLAMLRQAMRTGETARELEACGRLARAAPEILKRHLRSMTAMAAKVPARSMLVSGGAWAVELIRLAQEEDEDRRAIERVLDSLCERVRAGRVELQSAAGGALATIASSGTGLPSRLGQRALDAGITLGPEQRDGVWQLATPVRVGHRVLGVATCRWPLGRDALAAAGELFEMAAAIVAPRVDSFLAARAAAAAAATEVPELIGQSEAMVDVRRSIARAATAPFSVLVEGESGAGKELVARAIHQLSARRDRRFCDINCAALPDDLVEAELFGHAKGAFTGAVAERRGLFEEASGGTLFLDELPDLSLRSQAKLLRVLQQGEIRRVGETFARRVDVRLVAATNRPMHDEVAAGRFRQDLLYRIDVLRISIPPLRDRPVDVPLLAQHFWTDAAPRAGTRAALSHAVLGELARYHWPGNVRELQNVIAALAVAAPARGQVRATLLPAAITGSMTVASERLIEARRQFERRFIEVAIARAGGSRSKAAAQLGVSRQGLMKLMARLGIRVADGSDSGA